MAKWVTYGSRIVMALLIVGAWGAMIAIARAVMKPVFAGGLVTLRTQSFSRRSSSFGRVLVSTWLYAMVFILMWTAFTGMSIVSDERLDTFGFMKHVISKRFIVHPDYLFTLASATLVAIFVTLVVFSGREKAGPVNTETYDHACNAGTGAFFATGAICIAFNIGMEVFAST